ncbi:MAG: hypothetical protein HC802_02360 [Caldilineaceae bacterium]|nr:hypothetical protein [Caldilineaceae bacterium]
MQTHADQARRELVQAITLEPNGDFWRNGWQESFTTFPGETDSLLDPDFLTAQCRSLAISPDVAAVLAAGRSLFDRQPAARRLFWHCYHLLFKDPADRTRDEVRDWPMLPSTFDPAAPLFYAYVLLAARRWCSPLTPSEGYPPRFQSIR